MSQHHFRMITSAIALTAAFTAPATAVDCNTNAVDDATEIAGSNCRFPSVLTENSGGIIESIVLGAPDDTYIGLGADQVTFEIPCGGITNNPGLDITVYELDTGAIEFPSMDILVSENGIDYFSLKVSESPSSPVPGDGGHNNPSFARSYDLAVAAIPAAHYIRIQGTGSGSAGAANGFDLDAVGFVYSTGFEKDCNINAILDECELADGSEADCNNNNVPDSCESNEDCNANGLTDICEIATVQSFTFTSSFADGYGYLPWPYVGTLSRNIVVNDSFVVNDLDIRIYIHDHRMDSLIVRLAHNGTTITLADFSSCYTFTNPSVGIQAVFDDEGVSLVCASPIIGRITPSSAAGNVLSAFDGMDSAGTWTLSIEETEPYQHPRGRLVSWGLSFNRHLTDCNGNHSIDSCDISSGVSSDCNNDGVPDECNLASGAPDCNLNDIPDSCDIAGGVSADCDANGVPDSCEPDCDASGITDACELAGGTSYDCNNTGTPDQCDIASGYSSDCQGNGIPDDCEIDCNMNSVPDDCDVASGTSDDCNNNYTPDECERAESTCHFPTVAVENTLGVSDAILVGPPDGAHTVMWDNYVTYAVPCAGAIDLPGPDITVYEWVGGGTEFSSTDVLVSENGLDFISIASSESPAVSIPGDEAHTNQSYRRSYDIGVSGLAVAYYLRIKGTSTLINGLELDAIGIINADGFAKDCNANDTLDECDLASGASLDCQGNGVPDECDLSTGVSVDCNANLVPDACDIASANSLDCNTNGLPDECEDDCDGNGQPDDCDLAQGVYSDCNSNLVPDTCDLHVVDPACRYPSIVDIGTAGIADGVVLGAPDDRYLGLGADSTTYTVACYPLTNNPGPDLTLYEVDNGVQEFGIVDVLVSADGVDFVSIKSSESAAVGVVGDGAHSNPAFARSYDVNSSGLAMIYFVKIQGTGTGGAGASNGFDLDALGFIRNQSFDCNGNMVLDECEVAEGSATDCNANAIPDSCDIATTSSQDCDSNAVPDECDVDCDGNGEPDACDITSGVHQDCNTNHVPDVCELSGSTSQDCNNNDIPDMCEPNEDCNANGIADICDIGAFTSQDCNGNRIPDECEIDATSVAPGGPFYCAFGCAADCDADGVPDECAVGPTTVNQLSTNNMWEDASDTMSLSRYADDFILPIPRRIGAIEAHGYFLYWNQPARPRFRITIYDNDPHSTLEGGVLTVRDIPGEVIATVADTSYSIRPTGNYLDSAGEPVSEYALTFILPQPIDLTAGTYWLQILEISEEPGDVVFLWSEGAVDPLRGRPSYAKQNGGVWSPAVWTNANFMFVLHLQGDCDASGILDACEIAADPNMDCPAGSGNGILDSCETDCDGNGVADSCDIELGDAGDCDHNEIPDACESALPDTDGDGVLDACDACAGGAASGDVDADGDVDLSDYALAEPCQMGPGAGLGAGCECFDFDSDGDFDVLDFAELQVRFTDQ